jgi:AraC family transcriptional regulator, transcriptional activator of the genes for pyochelin and ferripyochelin receptors
MNSNDSSMNIKIVGNEDIKNSYKELSNSINYFKYFHKNKNLPLQNVRREINIRPGLWLSIIDFSPKEEVYIHYEREEPIITFCFVISGNVKNKVLSERYGEKDSKNKSGLAGIQFLHAPKGIIEILPQKKVKLLYIYMTIEFLQSLLKNDFNMIKPDFRNILEGDYLKNYMNRGNITPDIKNVVNQLFYPADNINLPNLYLEGKILELISLRISKMNLQDNKGKLILLSSEEKDRIFEAKNLLIKELDAPPTLNSLSKKTALSMNKLQAGFKEIYGLSVFDFFKEYKMQKARSLLEKTNMNISETAWAVGYINVSHFSAAFKKRFGILPKEFLKKAKYMLRRSDNKLGATMENFF